MKKNKKTFIIIGIVSIVLIGIVISFFINTKKDSYTLNEKEWIEENVEFSLEDNYQIS